MTDRQVTLNSGGTITLTVDADPFNGEMPAAFYLPTSKAPWEPWRLDAACLEHDATLFFPERGASVREAKAICASCLVRSECLDFAMRTIERQGIWGGLSEKQRRQVRRHTSVGDGVSPSQQLREKTNLSSAGTVPPVRDTPSPHDQQAAA